jgi:hypothetical protein
VLSRSRALDRPTEIVLGTLRPKHGRRELETYDPTSDGSTTRQRNLQAEVAADRAVEPGADRDETEKLVRGLGGLLRGEQSSHQRAAQLTAGLGVTKSPPAGHHQTAALTTNDQPRCRASRSERVFCSRSATGRSSSPNAMAASATLEKSGC